MFPNSEKAKGRARFTASRPQSPVGALFAVPTLGVLRLQEPVSRELDRQS